MKTLFDKNNAKEAYYKAKPYVQLAIFGALSFFVVVAVYIVDALHNAVIRARAEPFIALAALATIVYAVFAYGQWQVMSGQLQEMQEARRPWMQGDIQFVGPLVFDKDGTRRPLIS
jgi:hypothetical protein